MNYNQYISLKLKYCEEYYPAPVLAEHDSYEGREFGSRMTDRTNKGKEWTCYNTETFMPVTYYRGN